MQLLFLCPSLSGCVVGELELRGCGGADWGAAHVRGWAGVKLGSGGFPEDCTTLQESGSRVRLKVSCGGAYGCLILVL